MRGRGARRSPEAAIARQGRALNARILELASLHTLLRWRPSRGDAIARAHLHEALRDLDLHGLLLLVRADRFGPLRIAAVDGFPEALSMALASALSRRREGYLTRPHCLPGPELAEGGPLVRLLPPFAGTIALLPLAAATTAQPLGFAIARANRPGGIDPATVDLLAEVARNLALAVEGQLAPGDLGSRPLAGRGEVLGALAGELARAPAGAATSVAVIAVDSLRQVLAEAGADVGTSLLAAIAESLQGALRSADRAGRLDGGRFAAVLSGCSGTAALAVTDKLRAAVAARTVPGAALRIAIGIASGAALRDDAVSLLEQAEDGLRRALAEGGDRTVAGSDRGQPS